MTFTQLPIVGERRIAWQNQIACCQGAFFEAHAGSNGARFLRTPEQSITSWRMQAPTACSFGFPAALSLPKNPWRRGLQRMAVRVGRYSAWRRRAFPAFDSRVRWRTLDPERNSRGANPA